MSNLARDAGDGTPALGVRILYIGNTGELCGFLYALSAAAGSASVIRICDAALVVFLALLVVLAFHRQKKKTVILHPLNNLVPMSKIDAS